MRIRHFNLTKFKLQLHSIWLPFGRIIDLGEIYQLGVHNINIFSQLLGTLKCKKGRG